MTSSPGSRTIPAELRLEAAPETRPLGPERRPGDVRAALARLRRSPSALLGLGVLLGWGIVASFSPLLVPYDPNEVRLLEKFVSPSSSHLFGTDDLGRDVFSRVLAGSRSILVVSSVSTLLGIALGTMIGLAAGFYRSWIDEFLMRLMDILMAFPLIVIALLVLSVLGPSRLNVILVIALLFAPYNARVVRAAVLTERERDYVDAARLRGESGIYLMFAEILPNIAGTIIVELTFRLALAIFTVATLSFLGMGIQPPTPDWGLMIAQGRQFYRVAPWVVLFPSLAIASLVVAVNFVAEGMRR